MLNQERVRLMTRISIFENSKEGKESLRIGKFYKNDYIRWEMIKTILSVTIGYALILAMLALYYSEYLIANAVKLDYPMMGMKILGVYLLLLVFYISCAVVGYSYRYNYRRKNLVRYLKSLKRLTGFYRAEEKERSRQEVSEQ